MSLEITGKITAVLEKRTGTSKTTGNAWATQDYVLETDEQYPKHVCFNVYGEDKINTFAIKEDETLKVSFDIDAHEYQGHWYNTIRAWKVERPNANTGTQAAKAATQEAPLPTPEPTAPNMPAGDDGLPF